MLYGITWLLLIEVVGFATFVIFLSIFRTIPDKGYSISKPLGIICLSLATWLLSISEIIPATEIATILFFIGLIICSLIIGTIRVNTLKQVVKNNWRIISLTELTFLLTYLIFFSIRYFDPGINHTEQPMDFAFLNSSARTITGQPLDPWFHGETISYYYFGYWIFGTLSKISLIPTVATYNLSLVAIPAMTASSIFALTSIFLKFSRLKFDFLTISCSAFASLTAVFMGNLQGFLEFFRINSIGSSGFWQRVCIDGMQNPVINTIDSWRPTEFWWWFRSSRIINYFGPACEGQGLDYTINEFPFFSYLLGDLHPHVMATPFLLTFIYIAYDLSKKDLTKSLGLMYWLEVALAGIMLGCVSFISMWTAPICIAIISGVYGLHWISNTNLNPIKLGQSISLVFAMGALVLLPYLWSFQSDIDGLAKTQYQTSAIHGFVVWGPLLILSMPKIVSTFWATPISAAWRYHVGISLAVVSIPWMIRFLIPEATINSDGPSMVGFAFPITIFCFISTLTLLTLTTREGLSDRSLVFSIFSLSMFLILIPELFYVGDVYGNRMNTVFKLYYPAWILLSICGSYSAYYWLAGYIRPQKFLKYIYTFIAGLIILCAFYYPPAATMTKLSESSISGFKNSNARPTDSEISALDYAKQNISLNQGILESVGEWDSSGFISRNTGIPNLVNWPGHESQWRNSDPAIYQRAADVETIYSTENLAQAKSLLGKYDINFIYVGDLELSRYTSTQLGKFQSLGTLVFGNIGSVAIFEIDR